MNRNIEEVLKKVKLRALLQMIFGLVTMPLYLIMILMIGEGSGMMAFLIGVVSFGLAVASFVFWIMNMRATYSIRGDHQDGAISFVFAVFTLVIFGYIVASGAYKRYKMTQHQSHMQPQQTNSGFQTFNQSLDTNNNNKPK